jgi:hypothetical protein
MFFNEKNNMNLLPVELKDEIYSYDNSKYEIRNKLIRHINTIFREYNKTYNACLEIIMKSDSTDMDELQKNCWTDSHSRFILKYGKEPYKYCLDSIKRKELAFWY